MTSGQPRPDTAIMVERILMIDDDSRLAGMVSDYLGGVGFRVTIAGTAQSGEAMLKRETFDAVILDLMLPDADGLDLCRRLRGTTDVPILMLTARGEPMDRVVGLEVGADDYVVKPFEPRELLARIRSVLRRAASTAAASAPASPATPAVPDRVPVGRLELDLLARRLVDPDGREVPLTGMEFDLLRVLVRNPNRALSRDQLLDQAHNDSWEPFDRSIDIRIARLRKKVERDPASPELIRTIRGAGYMFVPEARG